MTGLILVPALWLPILVSAVVVFVASSIIHMVLPWHKGDYPKLANEDQVMNALRPLAIPPGDYMMPRPASSQAMRSPEFQEKLKRGPVVVMTVLPNGVTGMGKNLVQWFVFSVVVSVFAAYVAANAVPFGAPFRAAFKYASVTAFIGYALALWPMSIWYRRAWLLTIKATIDGVVYGLLTGVTFGWLWPLH
jgi:hypothetical protein